MPSRYHARDRTPLGLETKRSSRLFFVEDGRLNAETSMLLDTKRVSILDARAILQMRARGLDALANALRNPSPSPFESDVVRTVVLYSRGALTSDISQRLIYQLAALEGLLLKDGSEPIQQNLSERMAFLRPPIQTNEAASFKVPGKRTIRARALCTTGNQYPTPPSFVALPTIRGSS